MQADQQHRQQSQPQPQPQQLKATRLTRHSVGQESGGAAPRPSNTNVNRVKPATVPATAPPAPMSATVITQRPLPSWTAGAPGRQTRPVEPPIPHRQSVSVGRSKPIFMTTSVTQPSQPPISAAAAPNNGTPGRAGKGTSSGVQTDRNIDKVVLGNICFRAWYPSYYGKDVLGDISGGKDGKGNGTAPPHHYETKDDTNGAKAHGRRDRDGHHPPMLDRLYVCPCCFKYSKELVTWWEHVRACERRGFLPGEKIYIHPKGRRTVLVPTGPALKQGRGKRGSAAGQKMVEEVVQDEGEWSVREVDGESNVVRAPAGSSSSDLQAGSRLIHPPAALLPEPLALRKALPRQQVRLLRRHRLQILSPRPHPTVPAHRPRCGRRRDRAAAGPNRRLLLQRKNVVG